MRLHPAGSAEAQILPEGVQLPASGEKDREKELSEAHGAVQGYPHYGSSRAEKGYPETDCGMVSQEPGRVVPVSAVFMFRTCHFGTRLPAFAAYPGRYSVASSVYQRI